MRILVDTNILLDVLDARKDFYECSAAIWTLIETGQIEGYISAISFNNINYIIARKYSAKKAHQVMVLLRDIFKVVALTPQIINQAIDSSFGDFEDALQYFSAVHVQADLIISRNVKDFRKSDISVLTPAEFIETQTDLEL
jgi:predicted nucleic acid-binding protein